MRYVANSNSGIVHQMSCEWAEQIHPLNAVEFSEPYDAFHQGYEPCGNCILGLVHQYDLGAARRSRARAEFCQSCIVCGETRGIQRAHIIPRHCGGTHTMPLCPTCHWNYDHQILDHAEQQAVWRYLKGANPRLLRDAQALFSVCAPDVLERLEA